MISTASDFYRVTGADIDADHPHGDLDRIDLGWSAWFSRRGVGSAVRGDDIAFLMDFAQRRNYMATSGKRLSFGEYEEINPVTVDDVSSTTWPCYEGEVSAEFSRLITPDNFGYDYKGLYGAFAEMASNVAFFPYQGIDNISAVVDGNGWSTVKSQLGAMTLDVSGLKSAADFSGTNPPIVAADVQAYANKIFNADQKYGYFYLGDAGVGATFPNYAVSPGKYGSGATVVRRPARGITATAAARVSATSTSRSRGGAANSSTTIPPNTPTKAESNMPAAGRPARKTGRCSSPSSRLTRRRSSPLASSR